MSHFGVNPEDMIQMMRKRRHITRSQVFLINVTMIDAFPLSHSAAQPPAEKMLQCTTLFRKKISSDAPPRSRVGNDREKNFFFDRNMTYLSYIIKVLRGKAWRYL
ncbi:hypothetical protein CEXT_750281 [Caerostris extrusa]|uniref:Uncharacterized protein n=1 Tax=Caerostris extrusa TaxID=172846 RepID=A0AAV4W3V6_CAEEX|nr:hypothetical protein CEXT_750281 [Caerostris extrusa]